MYEVWQQQRVAGTIDESCFKQRCEEKSIQEAGSRNVIITDKYQPKCSTKVSRNSREGKITENFDGDYDFFRISKAKRVFAYFCHKRQKYEAPRLEREKLKV